MNEPVALSNLQISEISHLLVDNPPAVAPDTPFLEILQTIKGHLNSRHVYVTDDAGALLGAISLPNLIEHLFPLEATVHMGRKVSLETLLHVGGEVAADLMNPETPRVTETDTVGDMAALLLKYHYEELPVVNDEGKLTGQVNAYEIVEKYLQLAE